MSRICLLSQAYLPDIGGQQVYVNNIALALARIGHEVTVVAGQHGSWSTCDEGPPAECANGVTTVRIPAVREFCEGDGDLFSATALLLREVASCRPDVIYVQDPLLLLAASLSGADLQAPVFATYHWSFCNWETCEPRRDWGRGFIGAEQAFDLERRMVRFCLSNCNYQKLICVSEQFVVWARSLGVPDDRIVHLPNSVDTERFRPSRPDRLLLDRLGFDPEDQILLLPARIIPRKGIGEALHVVLEMKRILKHRVRLIILGAAHPLHHAYFEEIAAFVSSAGLQDDVVMTVATPQEMPSFYSIAKVLLFPSCCEGLSTTILEAMSSGVPVIARDILANREAIVHLDSGFLVSTRAAFVEAAVTLALDQGMCERIATQARNRVQILFDLDRMSKKLAQTLLPDAR